MLRVGGHSIINLREWRKYADFWSIYDQIQEFFKFAETHCIPVPLVDDVGEPAKYLDKPFWTKLLKKVYYSGATEAAWDLEGYQSYIADSCVRFYETEKRRLQILNVAARDIIPEDPAMWSHYVEQAIQELQDHDLGEFPAEEVEYIRKELEVPFSADNKLRMAVKAELNRFHTLDILQRICQSMGESQRSARIVLLCTAMQLITESGMEELNPGRQPSIPQIPGTSESRLSEKMANKNQGDKKKPACDQDGKLREADKEVRLSASVEILGIRAWREKTEHLSCRKEPYTWRLYEEEALNGGQRIQTVKFEAVQGTGDQAVIRLFSVKKQRVVFEFQMKPGEYRHGNITEDAVICFHPTVACCPYRCVSRTRLQEGELCVQDKRNKTQDSLSYDTDVSCFAVSGDGELYLRKGRLLLERFTLARRDKRVADQLEMISFEEFVEVELMEGGFLLLTNKGVIRSNLSDWDGKRAVRLPKNKYYGCYRNGDRRIYDISKMDDWRSIQIFEEGEFYPGQK